MTTTTFNLDDEITKLFNSLDENEKNIDKISSITHKCLLVMSVREATRIINSKDKSEKKDDEKQMTLFNEIIKECYLNKLESMRKKLLE